MGYKLYIKPLKMKRNIILTIFAVLLAMSASAQSTMTDTQVMEMLMKEKAAGTSQQQIVTKLMQSGVDIQQLRRVQKLAEREMKGTGLGNLSSSTSTQDRSRVANGKRREDYQRQEKGHDDLRRDEPRVGDDARRAEHVYARLDGPAPAVAGRARQEQEESVRT